MKYLIDTDVSIDHLAGKRDASELIRGLISDGFGISLITYGELYEGVLYSRRHENAEIALLSYLRWAKVLPLDEDIMRRFAGLRGFLRRAGMRIPDNDLLVAATALHFELVLVTRNVRHFERIDDLLLLPAIPSGS